MATKAPKSLAPPVSESPSLPVSESPTPDPVPPPAPKPGVRIVSLKEARKTAGR